MTLKTRFLGICPVCQGEYKLTNGSLVLHGYQRPGHGYLLGDCFGVGYQAYELSKQGCIEYSNAVIGQKERAETILASIDSGETKEAWVKRRTAFGKSEMVKVLSDDPNFNDALRTFRTMTAGEVTSCERELVRMAGLIAKWELKSVRSVEEAVRERDTQKEARKAEREVKRAEARAKEAAHRALVQTREAEKAALIATYKAKFEALAAGLESVRDRKSQARWDWVEMQKAISKRAYLYFYERSLECDEALKQLGLAEESATGTHTRYADKDGILL